MWCLRSAIRGLPRAPSLIGSGRSCDSLRVVLVPSSRLASSENNNSNIIPAAPLKNDPDSFGNLAPKNSVFRRQEVDPAEEEDDRGEAEYEAKLADTFRPRPIDYNRKMGRAIEKDKDLKEALRLLDEMKTELVKPNDGHFRALIHACGKVGYTKKAFELYHELRRRRLRLRAGMIADLFNACANSPHPEYALRKARSLRLSLDRENFKMCKVAYNNMIRAFGRGGDLESAFSAMDDMKRNQIFMGSDTYAALLQACSSDKVSGFRHAIIVWRRMLMNSRIKPDLFHYSLLLKTVKDCGVGDQAFVNDILLECMSNSEARKFGKALLENQQKPRLTEGGEPPVTGGKDESSIETEKRELEILPATSNGEISAKHLTKANNQLQPQLPNLLMAKPNFKNVVSLGALRTAEDRFQLIGGVDGFFQLTHSRGVQCNARMVTLMLDLIENSEEAELKLLDKAKEMKVTLDISFFNKLITRRAFRKDHKLGLSTLETIGSHHLEMDIVTFGAIASCCTNVQSAKDLVRDMKDLGKCPNVEIYGALLGNAVHNWNSYHVNVVLSMMDADEVLPNPRVLRKLELFYHKTRMFVKNVERGSGPVPAAIWVEKEQNYVNLRKFFRLYKAWLRMTEIEMPQHPWKQYLTERDIAYAEHDSMTQEIIDENSPLTRSSYNEK